MPAKGGPKSEVYKRPGRALEGRGMLSGDSTLIISMTLLVFLNMAIAEGIMPGQQSQIGYNPLLHMDINVCASDVGIQQQSR
ncbi:hypothetical protein AVL56_18645 [Alteromonas stellipolaris]|jgi:hypothetical protein|uniref:Uncharacterized protein n=2 Tax=Alteromonas stellipolaris TaxID=233316 RepID=A0ABM5YNF0_9ALTE|nr:hypothetical protein AVL57_19825 [Alteromonas stellipolaris]AMJ88440.1 hypothetical protein AV939_18795 [Alteromonas sp. Mac1]AMJ92294.1 hypothetical protein AV940_18490 [Alteromonas sp. Mac2]AMJ96131.1 hypothetical protein AVL56_18645 [Alteromonas stellipolaris]ANB20842.1 hypothetical protein A6K25_05820 [Alteromonas stellipolaris]